MTGLGKLGERMLILLDIEAMIKSPDFGLGPTDLGRPALGSRPGDWQGERLLADSPRELVVILGS